MCFLLALVLLLMQRAADPGYYESAFRALGVPFDESGVPFEESTPTGSSGSSPQTLSSKRNSTVPESTDRLVWSATCRDLVPRIFEVGGPKTVREFAAVWFQLQRPLDFQYSAELVSNLQESAQDISLSATQQLEGSTIAADELESWRNALDRFPVVWADLMAGKADGDEAGSAKAKKRTETANANGMEVAAEVSDPNRRWQELRLAETIDAFLDGQLGDLVFRDASPWRTSEQVAFERWLQKADRTTLDDWKQSPRIRTQQLEAESQTLKGRCVRFRGEIHQIEYVERRSAETDASAVPLEREGYWVVWLRGVDLALQPVAVYTQNSAAGSYVDQVLSEDRPEIEVCGWVGKRLAYGSESGVQVAPTLFVGPIEELTAGAAESEVAFSMDEQMWGQLGNAAGIGFVFALLILIPIWRNWRRSPVTTTRSVFGKDFGKRRSERKSLIGWIVLSLTSSLVGSGDAAFVLAQESKSADSVGVPWKTGNSDRLQQRISLLQDRLEAGVNSKAAVEYKAFLSGNSDVFPPLCLKALDGLHKLGWKLIPSDFSIRVESGGQKFLLQRGAVKGYVRSARQIGLTDSQESWFQQSSEDRVFELQIEVTNGEASDSTTRLKRVFCRTVPSMWIEAKQLRQPVHIQGVRCSLVGETGREGQGVDLELDVYLAGTPEWILRPEEDEGQLAPVLPEHLVALGKAGWNLSGLEAVQSRNQQKIGSQESPGFMQLIRLSQEGLLANGGLQESNRLEPMQALAESGNSFAKPVRWRVRIATASVVTVDNENLSAELNASRYVQFDGFVDIGSQAVEYKVAGESIRFEREFPVTLVAPYKQPYVGEQRAAKSELGWEVGAYFEIDGLYYRLWSYQSELVKKKSDTARQVSPLVVLTDMRPTLAPASPSRAGEIGWFGYALCAATLVILAAILYLAGQPTKPRMAR